MGLKKPNKELALIFGILAGDGCISGISKRYNVSVTCNIHDDEPFIKDVVIPLITKIREKETKYLKRAKYGKIEINFSDKEFFNLIRNIGFPVGKKEGLKIPKIFPEKLHKHIIAGYFSTDGCIVLTNNNGIIYPRIEIQSKSFDILEQTKNFLVNGGMKGYVYRMDRKYDSGEERIMYRMQFNGLDNLIKFRDLIGFINPKHEEKFKKYIKSRGSSVVRAPHNSGDAHKRVFVRVEKT